MVHVVAFHCFQTEVWSLDLHFRALPAQPLLTSWASALQPWGTLHALANACSFLDRLSISHLFTFACTISPSRSTFPLLYLIPEDFLELRHVPQHHSMAGSGVLSPFL